MIDKKNKAKAIFFKYNGEHFQIEREGFSETYKAFKVDQQQENEWRQIIFEDKISNLKKKPICRQSFSIATSMVKENNNIEMLQSFLRTLQKIWYQLDTFTRVLYLEEMVNLFENPSNKDILFFQPKIVEILKQLIKEVINEPVKVHLSYLKIKYLKECISEEKIKERIRKLEQLFNKAIY